LCFALTQKSKQRTPNPQNPKVDRLVFYFAIFIPAGKNKTTKRMGGEDGSLKKQMGHWTATLGGEKRGQSNSIYNDLRQRKLHTCGAKITGRVGKKKQV